MQSLLIGVTWFKLILMPVTLNPFFESSLDLLCVANYEGYFVDVNPAFVKMIGYTKEELFSKKINEFVCEEDRQSTIKNQEGLYHNQSLINFENRYITKFGEVIGLSWSAVPVKKEKLVYAIAKDITHNKVLKNERLDELVKLTQKNEELTRLNLITSHDLGSPINSVLSLSDLIEYDEIKNKETLEILEYIEIGVKGVENSLDNYLDVMRSSSFGSAALEEVMLSESLIMAINSVGSLIQNSNTQIVTDFSSFESVIFNKAYMESIFLNLITNAIKYAKPGIPPVVTIVNAIENRQKVLRVKDNGSGFDMDKTGHQIFTSNERFNEAEEGKGVGLYLIQNQIASLGGEITVKSELNLGATFSIRFKTN